MQHLRSDTHLLRKTDILMKKFFLIFAAACILGCIFPVTASAQYASVPETIMPDESVETVYVGHGQGLADAGKTLMFTGASVAVTSLAVFLGGSLTFEQSECCPTMPVFPLIAISGGAVGAVMALIGLPFHSVGLKKMRVHGGTHMTFGKETGKGVSGIFELGAGIPALSADALCGYEFNRNIFLGAGLGYKVSIMGKASETDKATMAVPVYANARFSFGDKRVVPYISPSIGYDMFWNDLYIGLDTGARLRCARRDGGASWWLGTRFEYINDDANFISLKLARSF